MARLALLSIVVCGTLQAVMGSQGWSQFLETGESLPSSSRRLQAWGVDTYNEAGLKAISIQAKQSNVDKTSMRYVTVNSFISKKGSLEGDDIKKNIMSMCKTAALGTEFTHISQKSYTDNGIDEPMCYYCLAQGYGVDEATPGYYLPCGCQRVCVDVSGNSQGSFSSATTGNDRTGFPYLSNSVGIYGVYGKGGKPTSGSKLSTCQDYIDQKMVTTCNQIYIFHFVLWPSLLGMTALLYSAYSIANMPLDMDSLLFTMGSSSKKDN